MIKKKLLDEKNKKEDKCYYHRQKCKNRQKYNL